MRWHRKEAQHKVHLIVRYAELSPKRSWRGPRSKDSGREVPEWLKCCFTSIETVGVLGTGAQDVHLDFHTASELCGGNS